MTRIFSTALILVMLAGTSACGGKEGRAQGYLEKAQKSFDQGDYVKSELDAKNTLKIDPNNLAAVKLMAELAEKQDKTREYFQYLMKTVEMDPSDIDAHVKLGRIFVAVQRNSEAQSHADSALGIDPDNIEARILNATIMFREGEVDEARAIAMDVLDKNPRNSAALAFLASTYLKSEPDRAIDLLNRAVAAEPDNQGLRKVKLALLNQLGRTDQLDSELRDAIATFPDDREYRYSLANLLAREGDTDGAEQVLLDIIRADDSDLTAKLYYAQFLGNKRNPEAAVEKLKEYINESPDVYEYRFALGQVYVMTRQLEKAAAVYQQIVDLDARGPGGLEARNKLASLKMLSGDTQGARAMINNVLAEEAANPDALLMRASLYLKNENSSAAIADLRTILRDNPAHENARLLLGKAHAQAGEKSLATEELQRLVDAHPENIEGRRDLAVLLVQSQRWDEVRELLELGVKQAPDDLQMTRMLIDAYMRQQEWDLAEGEARRVLEKNPESPMGHYVLARILQSRGDFAASIPKFKEALKYNPDAIESITGLIRSYVRVDDNDGALEFLETFSPEHPENVEALALWGEILARAGRDEEAVAKNEEALAINPSWLPAYRNLIGIYMRDNDYAKADQTVSRGLEAAPDNADLLMLRASIYEKQERWDDAIEVYGGVLEANPGQDIAANNYIALVADHRTSEAALEQALVYAQRFRDSDNPIFQDTLGWLYYRMGEYNDALPLLERAVSRAGQLQQLRYHLGMTYFKLDKLDLARRELEAAVENKDAKYVGFDEAMATLKLL